MIGSHKASLALISMSTVNIQITNNSDWDWSLCDDSSSTCTWTEKPPDHLQHRGGTWKAQATPEGDVLDFTVAYKYLDDHDDSNKIIVAHFRTDLLGVYEFEGTGLTSFGQQKLQCEENGNFRSPSISGNMYFVSAAFTVSSRLRLSCVLSATVTNKVSDA